MGDDDTESDVTDQVRQRVETDCQWLFDLGVLDRPLTDDESASVTETGTARAGAPSEVPQRAVEETLRLRNRAFVYSTDMLLSYDGYGDLIARYQGIADGLLAGLEYDIAGGAHEEPRLRLRRGRTTVEGRLTDMGTSVDPDVHDLLNRVVATVDSSRRFEWLRQDTAKFVGFLTPVRAAAVRVYTRDRTRKLPPAAGASWQSLLDHVDAAEAGDRHAVAATIAAVDFDAVPALGDAVPLLRSRLREESDPAVRRAWVETLCDLAMRSEAAVDAVVAAIGSERATSELFEAVLDRGVGYGSVLPPDDPAVHAALDSALAHREPAVRAAAAELAVTYGLEPAADRLLEDPPVPTAETAAPLLRAVGELEADRATDYVTTALREGATPSLRVTAAASLGELATADARDALVAALVDDSEAVREEAYDQLSGFQTDFGPVSPPGGSIPPVVARELNGDGRLTSEAIRVVGHLDTRAAIDQLCVAADSSDRLVRLAAVEWLSERPVDEAIPTLAEVVRANEDELLVKFALTGLAKSTRSEAKQTFEMARHNDAIDVPGYIEEIAADNHTTRLDSVLSWLFLIPLLPFGVVACTAVILLYPLFGVEIALGRLRGTDPSKGTLLDMALVVAGVCGWAAIAWGVVSVL